MVGSTQKNGKFAASIVLGDGINICQVDTRDVIWTGYFDEGIFGNFGWEQPLGSSGLVAWNAEGNQVYRYEPPDGLDTICDCYALNVDQDCVWASYYTEFPLIEIRGGQCRSRGIMPISGCSHLAIGRGHIICDGGYDGRKEWHLLSLPKQDAPKRLSRIQIHDSIRQPVTFEYAKARGSTLALLSGHHIYRFDVCDVLNQLD